MLKSEKRGWADGKGAGEPTQTNASRHFLLTAASHGDHEYHRGLVFGLLN